MEKLHLTCLKSNRFFPRTLRSSVTASKGESLGRPRTYNPFFATMTCRIVTVVVFLVSAATAGRSFTLVAPQTSIVFKMVAWITIFMAACLWG